MIGTAKTTLLRAPTATGIEAKRQIEGFRQYLVSVERDRLDKLNEPEQAPVMLDEQFAFAIVLEVREGWGDRLENALFGVATWR